MFLSHYIAPAHTIREIMIIFGAVTRWAIIAQLPILITAVIVNFIGEMNSQNLFLALVNSTVYVVFFYGSEEYMADYYFKMQNNKPKKSINKVTDAFFIV